MNRLPPSPRPRRPSAGGPGKHRGARIPLVLTCEHAGRAVPAVLADYAPHDDNMARQLAYDLGVARAFAERLDAPLALHRPYRQAVDGMIEACGRPAPLSGHSFTKQLRGKT